MTRLWGGMLAYGANWVWTRCANYLEGMHGM